MKPLDLAGVGILAVDVQAARTIVKQLFLVFLVGLVGWGIMFVCADVYVHSRVCHAAALKDYAFAEDTWRRLGCDDRTDGTAADSEFCRVAAITLDEGVHGHGLACVGRSLVRHILPCTAGGSSCTYILYAFGETIRDIFFMLRVAAVWLIPLASVLIMARVARGLLTPVKPLDVQTVLPARSEPQK
jgi:hypothetical protein